MLYEWNKDIDDFDILPSSVVGMKTLTADCMRYKRLGKSSKKSTNIPMANCCHYIRTFRGNKSKE